jgi:hypothetical protein
MNPAAAAKAMPLLVPALLAGCAAPPLGRIDPGQPVALVAAEGESSTAPLDITDKTTGNQAGSGALSGSALGLVGLTCGAWALVCVPYAAMIGAGVGALGGTVIGIAGNLSVEKGQALRDRVEAYRATNDPRQRLVQAIADEAKGHWTLAPDGATTTVVVKLEEVALHAMPREHIALWMKASVTVRRQGATQGTSPESKTYDYLGPASEARLWLEDRDGFVAWNFADACTHIAQGVFADLAR